MKKFLALLSLILISTSCFAVEITEEDLSPSTYPYQVKFSNGSLTDNGDGTVSVSTGVDTTANYSWTGSHTFTTGSFKVSDGGSEPTYPETADIIFADTSGGSDDLIMYLIAGSGGGESNQPKIFFGDTSDADAGKIIYNLKSIGTDYFEFFVDAVAGSSMRLYPSGLRLGNIVSSSPDARLHIETDGTGTIGQIIDLAASQTADAINVDNSSGTTLFSVDKDGVSHNRNFWTFSTVLESPADADNFNLFKAPYAITITDIDCLVDPADSAESVVIDIQERDSTADNPATVDATITCDNDGAADDGTLSNGTIDSGDWVSLDIGTVTGTVTQLTVTVKYQKDMP